MSKRRGIVTQTKVADEHNVVKTVVGGPGGYRKTPCAECPWKKANTGSFPAEAFRHSANTAYDMATHMFACHESPIDRPVTCAGFLLKNAVHNLAVRLKLSQGIIDPTRISDDGEDLFGSYREMAVANGVAPDDSVLAPCRGK